MKVSYEKLWKLLDKKNIGRIEMRRDAGFAPITFIRMTRGELIPEKYIKRICENLGVTPDDIMEIIPDEEENNKALHS